MFGKEVVTDGGDALGQVVDVVVEVERGEAIVVGCEVSRAGEGRLILPLPSGIPVLREALIVPAAAEPYAATGLGGFREVLARARRGADLIRLSQVKGRRVMARDNAQVVGTVRRLHLDVDSARIVSIELDGAIDRETIVEWPAVVAINDDALLIENASDRREPLDATEHAFVAGELDLEGKLVLDDSGDALGRLEDIVYDERTGRLAELLFTSQSVAVERTVALGSYALIISAPES